jgi:uncharacterized protein (AIM24 family)
MQFQNNNVRILNSMKKNDIIIEIIQCGGLPSNYSPEIAQSLIHHDSSYFSWQQVRILLQNSSVIMESGALQFMLGKIEIENKTGGIGGFAKKLMNSAVTGETMYKPTYKGSGEIYLEPSQKYFSLVELNNEELIVDDGLFFCSESTVKVESFMQKNISSALFGGEGLFQTKLSGSGFAVLAIPVPEYELIVYDLKGETLKVDGTFAILRSGSVEFTVEKSTKSLLGTSTSGEGLLQTFTGYGEVWLAPTLPIRYPHSSN